jgi:hypothetical protein
MKIEDTIPGRVDYYTTFDTYVLRRLPTGFVGLANGDTYDGKDGALFPVDAELVIR